MNPHRGKTAQQIRWHQVEHLDLLDLSNSLDDDVMEAAKDELQRRQILAGQAGQKTLKLDDESSGQ